MRQLTNNLSDNEGQPIKENSRSNLVAKQKRWKKVGWNAPVEHLGGTLSSLEEHPRVDELGLDLSKDSGRTGKRKG